MKAYIARRLLQGCLTLLGVTLITFLLTRMTGDPARLMLGIGASQDAVDEFRVAHGLSDPLAVQYWRFLTHLARGDLGVSIRFREPVLQLFLARLPATFELGVVSYVLSLLLGIGIGIYSALHWNTALDRIIRVLVLVGQAIPGFYLGLLLIILFSVAWGVLPSGGRGSFAHLILPATTLGVYLAALTIRFTRAALLDVLRQDYIRTARSKGLGVFAIQTRHAIRNALIPLVTVFAAQASVIFSGAVVTETVFSWPGVGRFAVDAIQARDFPVVQGAVLAITIMVLALNLVVDISYAYLDPRIRYT